MRTARRVAGEGSDEQLDLAVGCGRSSEVLVSRDERGLEDLGEDDVRGVVGSEVLAKLPDPAHQRLVWGTLERQGSEIGECLVRSFALEPARPGGTPPHGRNFEIDQLRRGEALADEALASPFAV